MSGKMPCNCHEKNAFGGAPLPTLEEVRANLHAAFGTEAIAPFVAAANVIPDPHLHDAHGAISPAVAPGIPAGDLTSLVALAKSNPGLRITVSLSFDRTG